MTDRERLERTIAALEAQRPLLGDDVVETALAPLREQLAALGALPHVERRRQVTVLFGDIADFTARAEVMDPEDVNALLRELWSRLDAIIAAHGGKIDKHIGDGVMAIWGADVAREDDPERAIRAALAIQTELLSFVPWPDGAGNPLAGAVAWTEAAPTTDDPAAPAPLRMRIGINTGLAVLGEVGATGEYTALGDTVNLASRLEAAAPLGGILIAHDTYRHVRGVFEVQVLDPLPMRGKAEPVQVYAVLAAKPRAFRVPTRGVEGVETRMIGRDADLARLQAVFLAALADRQRRLVTLVGEAGIGKSRLLDEFMHWLELRPERMRLFQGRADEGVSALPYGLVRDLLASRFQIQDSDPPALARSKLERGIAQFMGTQALEPAHFLGHLIGLDCSDSPFLRGALSDPKQLRDRAFHSAVRLFEAIARRQPVALMLEDLHWADSASLDLVDHVARALPHLPLLIVGLTRPALFERHPHWGEGDTGFIRLDLHPLSAAESGRLVEEILRRVEHVPDRLREVIVAGAEGNPFYVEELIKMLVEEGVIRVSEDTWEVALDRLTGLRVPASLTGVVQARLDALPPDECEVLKCASVVGGVFWESAVAALLSETGDGGTAARSHEATQTRSREGLAGSGDPEAERASVAERLEALRRRELIVKRAGPASGYPAFGGTTEYAFKHIILREVTYESVLLRQRRAYHAQVAAWLLAQSGERAEAYAGPIAEHYERAGDTVAAAEWYGRAARGARMASAPEAAIRFYQRALALLPAVGRPGERVALYGGLGEMLFQQARFDEAVEAYTAMRAAAEVAGDPTAQVKAWIGLSHVQEYVGDYPLSLESARRAETIARELAGDGGEALRVLVRALFRKGRAYYQLGDNEAAVRLGQEALELSTALRLPREMADSHRLIGTGYALLGRHAEAREHEERALEMYREQGNRVEVGTMLNNLGSSALLRGDYEVALPLYVEAVAVARETGSLRSEIVALTNLGWARIELGEHAAAETSLRQALTMAQTTGHRVLALTEANLALACLEQGRPVEALAAAKQAVALARKVENQEVTGWAWHALGLIAVRLDAPIEVDGQPHAARDCFAEALRIYTCTGMEGYRARVLRTWGRYELEHGDRERGAAMWREARALFERLDMPREVERTPPLPGRERAATCGYPVLPLPEPLPGA